MVRLHFVEVVEEFVEFGSLFMDFYFVDDDFSLSHLDSFDVIYDVKSPRSKKVYDYEIM